MNKQYYSSNLLNKKIILESYFDNIIESVKKINGISINNDWKCEGNEEINKQFTSLKELTNNINICLESYKEFLTTVDNAYSGRTEEIKDAIKGINIDS